MIRRTLRGGLWLGLLVAVVLVVARVLRTRSAPGTIDLRSPDGSSEPATEPWPPLQGPTAPAEAQAAAARQPAPAPSPTPEKKTLPPWVAPENGVCPQTHPVKAKLSSGIFQIAGNAMYQRTNPDRCYESPEAAAADGLRPAKR